MHYAELRHNHNWSYKHGPKRIALSLTLDLFFSVFVVQVSPLLILTTTLPQSVGRQMGYQENLSRRRNAQTSGKVKREEPLTKIQCFSAREFSKVSGSVQCAGIPQILVGLLL